VNPPSRPSVLIDCDPGHDDVLAIVTAAAYANVVGITTVAGNAALEFTTRNALVTAELTGLDVPVHAGAAGPLTGDTRDATHVHGDAGLAGVVVPDPHNTPAGTDACAFIVEQAHTVDDLWIVAVGPLTNVALALEREPTLATTIAGISIMGGGTFGNATPAAEFNIWADPEAADVVFRSGARLRMCGLDLTHQVCADAAFVATLFAFGSPLGDFTGALLSHYRARIIELTGDDLAALHDPCAVLAVTHPECFGFGRHSVRVELAGKYTRGMTVIDRRRSETGAVEVAWRADAPRALEMIAQAVASATTS
jgi:inosine-uridine nucleoside N-ribohydrolase